MNRIEITSELLADLKTKAEKATPGPWIIDCDGVGYVETFWGHIVADSCDEWDAAYITAANPQVVLNLIEHIEGLEKELDAARYSEANESGRVARLERESDWLAGRLQKFCDHTLVCMSCPCRLRGGCHNNNWRNAAREAIDDADDAMEAEQEERER